MKNPSNMETKLYEIQVKKRGNYIPLDGIEYTLQEANAKMKDLCINSPGTIFRRHYLRTANTETLSIHNHK